MPRLCRHLSRPTNRISASTIIGQGRRRGSQDAAMLRGILHVSAEGRGNIAASQHPELLLADATRGKKIINTSTCGSPRSSWRRIPGENGKGGAAKRLQLLTDGSATLQRWGADSWSLCTALEQEVQRRLVHFDQQTIDLKKKKKKKDPLSSVIDSVAYYAYRLLVISCCKEEEALVSLLAGRYHGQRLTSCLYFRSCQRRRAGSAALFISTWRSALCVLLLGGKPRPRSSTSSSEDGRTSEWSSRGCGLQHPVVVARWWTVGGLRVVTHPALQMSWKQRQAGFWL